MCYPVQPFSCDCMQNHPLGFANACEHNQPALCTSSLAHTSVPYSCRNHFSATAPAATRPAPAHSRTPTTCVQDDTAAVFADIYLQRGMTEKTGLAVNPPSPFPVCAADWHQPRAPIVSRAEERPPPLDARTPYLIW
eukprot:COSAG01_NODE_6997_length_3399_cov_2.340000_3_plen_137_part_00